MLSGKRQDCHHSRLPKAGEIGTIKGLESHGIDPLRKCIVSHFPLTDSPDYRYSMGIHTIFVRFLDNGEVRQFSGFYFEAWEA